MLWITLWNKIGKQPLKLTKHAPVYALLSNPKTHRMEKVYLRLNYDTSGHPYLIADNMKDKENRKKK